jgi:pyridoxal phosphate enzyme (YggS family)
VARLIEGLDAGRVRTRLDEVTERIAGACARSGRSPRDVEVLAATKYVPLESMGALAEAGIRLIGENTAQALQAKRDRWGELFIYDFIGHLQSRKTKVVLPLVRLIHSVESESVLAQIERHAEAPAAVLLEVNVAGEESKHGVRPADVDRFLELAARYEKATFAGLMTMPPFTTQPEEARPHFAALRTLAERLKAQWAPRHELAVLSMGTSQDFEVAVEEGATLCRLGTALYQ